MATKIATGVSIRRGCSFETNVYCLDEVTVGQGVRVVVSADGERERERDRRPKLREEKDESDRAGERAAAVNERLARDNERDPIKQKRGEGAGWAGEGINSSMSSSRTFLAWPYLEEEWTRRRGEENGREKGSWDHGYFD